MLSQLGHGICLEWHTKPFVCYPIGHRSNTTLQDRNNKETPIRNRIAERPNRIAHGLSTNIILKKGVSHQIRFSYEWYYWRDLKEQPCLLKFKYFFNPLNFYWFFKKIIVGYQALSESIVKRIMLGIFAAGQKKNKHQKSCETVPLNLT